ncbi:hypothetical protein L208DRAFT_1491822 [Tricholoma matsutake]|nr:hypothetical protein L208DRAFT_1491822 [Tricholoma matsutake 945]
MPHCPNCSCKWPDQMSVLAHMNQPLGSCYNYQEEMTSIADELQQFHHHKKMQTILDNSHWEDVVAEVQVDMDVDIIELSLVFMRLILLVCPWRRIHILLKSTKEQHEALEVGQHSWMSLIPMLTDLNALILLITHLHQNMSGNWPLFFSFLT